MLLLYLIKTIWLFSQGDVTRVSVIWHLVTLSRRSINTEFHCLQFYCTHVSLKETFPRLFLWKILISLLYRNPMTLAFHFSDLLMVEWSSSKKKKNQTGREWHVYKRTWTQRTCLLKSSTLMKHIKLTGFEKVSVVTMN